MVELLRVGTDIDGCVIDCASRVLLRVNAVAAEVGKDPFAYDDFSDFYWASKIVTAMTGDPERGRSVEGAFFDPAVLLESQPYLGAIQTWWLIELLKRKGEIDDYFFVTSRRPNAREETLGSFGRHLPWVGQDQIVMRTDESIGGEQFKGQACERLGLRLFFEDHDVTRDHLVGVLPEMTTVLVDRPWNRHRKDIGSGERAYSQLGIHQRVVDIASGQRSKKGLWSA